MKKVLRLTIIFAVAFAAFFLFRSTEKPVSENSSAPAKPAPPAASKKVIPVPADSEKGGVSEKNSSQLSGFLSSDVMSAVRSAVSNSDRTGYEGAFKALIQYITDHPDEIDNYLSVFRSEKNEHVLRTFTLALAETEVGLLANDRIIAAAIELAKDPSFEQRQHIMLNLMSKFPEMRDDVFQTVHDLSRNDPNSQVKTSAIVVYADWMDRMPEQKEMLLGQLAEIFATAKEEDVRGFTYQILALHRDELSKEMQSAISDRLKIETDPFNANLLAAALSAAPDDVRQGALTHVQSAFAAESDLEKRRNLLVQIVCLAKGESVSLLKKNSSGDSLLAQDARDYLNLLASNSAVDPDAVLQQKAIRDANQQEIKHKD